MISLLKCSPTYSKNILEYPFPDPTIETAEGTPLVRQPSRRQVRSRTPPEKESEPEEENSRSPIQRLHNRDIWHGTTEKLINSLFEKAIPQHIDEARQIVHAAISYGPMIRMAAWVGKLYLHDLLVDYGAEVTLITLGLAKKILEANPEVSIKYDRSLNIGGVAGKTTMKGYLIAQLDFGQGVKANVVLYILGENILNTELLLSNLFIASINAMISMRHDYMMVPTLSAVPVSIHGNNLMVEDWSHFKEEKDIGERKEIGKQKDIGEEKKIDDEEIGEGKIYELEEYCVEDSWFEAKLEKAYTKEVKKKKPPSIEEVEDKPFAVESIATKMVEVNEWTGSDYVNSEEFKGIVALIWAIPGFQESRFEELDVSSDEATVSQAQTYEPLIAGGCPEELAKEELEKLQLDDITWWVCMEDVIKVQKKRLVDLLRSMRPWVVQRLAEMRHCSPKRCQQILRILQKPSGRKPGIGDHSDQKWIS
ncbi:hypothetical protein BDD12DRAFT_885500 [Trichophaea hybrida]|nr:hypothetical protein BDD12DRAFT_885500 [Trichophaea hybrida]